MSYLVLARKYRPASFADMVGQSHVVRALTNALTQQRLHHAYLFTGTRGVGKTTVSRILAKALNCLGTDGQGGITAEPCGVCASCTAIDAGRFVDYTELDAASNRGISEIQSLLEQAVYKPVEGRFKVFMIDEVHMLTDHAFNAMLKTLEEPPEYLKFVLATTDPQKIPVTVLSRCLQFNLRSMAPETIAEHLARVLGLENITHEAAAIHLIAQNAGGSMRDALSLCDQAIAFGNGQLQEQSVRGMLGVVDQGYIFDLIDALAIGDGQRVIGLAQDLRLGGFSASQTLADMAQALHHIALAQMKTADSASDDSPIPSDASARTRLLAQQMPAEEVQLLYSLCIHGRSELFLAPDEYAGLVMTLLRLLAFKPAGFRPPNSPNTTLEQKKKLDLGDTDQPLSVKPVHPNIGAVKPAPIVLDTIAPAPDPDPAPSTLALPVREMRSEFAVDQRSTVSNVPSIHHTQWLNWVGELIDSDSLHALYKELAIQSYCSAMGEDWLTLCVEQSALRADSVREKLQAALAAHLGKSHLLRVEIGEVPSSWYQQERAQQQQRQTDAETQFHQNPLVQESLAAWGGRVVQGSIKPIA